MFAHIDFAANALKTRKEVLHGREHLVAPVVMLVEGVHNGLYYPPTELAKFPEAWNGRPVPVQHPTKDGTPISCNDPDTIQKQTVGWVFNTKWDANKLRGEVWVDVDKCRQISPQALSMLQKGEALEISTGLFLENDGKPGEWNGEAYNATVCNFRPDHLALLPGGKGACCWGDGCGVRVNKESGMTVLQTIRTKLLGMAEEVAGLDDAPEALNFLTNEKSFREVERLVRDAIRAKVLPTKGKGYVDLTEVYDTHAIYRVERYEEVPTVDLPGAGYYQVDYAIKDGEAKLGEPKQVERVISYRPVVNEEEPPCGDDFLRSNWAVEKARRARASFEANRAQ